MTNKHEAMLEYLKQYPSITSFLYFNAISEAVNETAFNPIYSQEVIKQYTSGDTIRKYDFAIVQMLIYDADGTSTVNTDAMFDVEQFMSWITEQNKNKAFPDFGENRTVLSIENLQNMPNLAQTTETDVAKYMFQCSVKYLEEMEK